MAGLFKTIGRWRISKRPFPDEWRQYLRRYLVCYERMPEDWRNRFEKMVQVFIAERTWIPAGGMQITDEVKVVIAGSAVRLILRLDLSYYDRLTEIVVYPYIYRHGDEAGVAILGEAQPWGTVVLSWPAVVSGLAHPCDGMDTAVHEFAHVLDRDNGSFDGTPFLRNRDDYAPWATILGGRFEGLREGKPSEMAVLRMYGATNPAEFFSVATEAFFETPDTLKEMLPDLYEVLAHFYGGDPFTFGYCPAFWNKNQQIKS